MKKNIILLFLIMTFSFLFAIDSEPSDVVGFVKISVEEGYTAFGMPLQAMENNVATNSMSVIFGNKLIGGSADNADKIFDITAGTESYLKTDGTWSNFSELTPGHAYYIQNKHTPINIYLCGKVSEENHDYGSIGLGYTAFAINSARIISLNNLDLINSGFTGGAAFNSDKIFDITAGTESYLKTDGTWSNFSEVIPGHAYYLQNKHSIFNWIYNPARLKSSSK